MSNPLLNGNQSTKTGQLQRSRERELCEEGFVFRPVQAYDIVPLLSFCLETFKWDWYRHMREALMEKFGMRPTNRTTVVLAEFGGRIVGYAQQTEEHFGPFGVHPDYRGKGVGRVLCAKCLMEARTKGYHCAWFKWTGDYQAGVYFMAGFKETRRYEVMEKSLE